MGKQNKRKRQEEQRKYLQRWSRADYAESVMINLKMYPENQRSSRIRLSKYAKKMLFRELDEDETIRRWKQ